MNTHSVLSSANLRSVHIVLSDRGWILERLAKEIADRVPYVSYSLEPDPAALIQYYITYGCRKERVSPIEVALFTHREEDARAGARFDAAAKDVDHAVSMSSGTARLVESLGIAHHSCIMPGVDLDSFHPKLKIAVVGRTYHTGRKGEALVRSVMDVPDIEWHFTGTGWPGPAEHVAEADLPAFYRSMDYILVPALNEGGPMSVLEALASGVQVIASTVGWVPDFPHIPFERGNAESLRAVLMGLREERMKLRASVEHLTWDQWAVEHDTLFRRLIGTLNPSGQPPRATLRRAGAVCLVTHGIEDSTLGGPSVRVPATARALRTLNVNANVVHNRGPAMATADLVHGFNIWAPKTAVAVAREAKQLHRPLVFSPILLDLSEGPLWRADVLRVFRRARTAAEADVLMQRYVEIQRERVALLPPIDPEPGYADMVREIAELSDALIFLSAQERAAFHKIAGTNDTPGYLVHNPVDAAHFRGADPALFRQAYGLQDYILCVARLEPRKNQLMLVSALRDSGLPVVLVGHSSHAEYAALTKRFGGPNLLMIDRLDPGSAMLRSAIAGARVFVLPSWAEGAPLAALEAAAAGTNLVLSDRSSERQYFGDHARYCNPADMTSIRKTVLEAWDSPLDAAGASALSAYVEREYSWEKHARATLDVYEDVLERERLADRAVATSAGQSPRARSGEIVFDVTTWANHSSTLSGIVRVERSIALQLLTRDDVRVRFVMYYSSAVGFLELPSQVVAHDLLPVYVAQLKSQALHERVALRFAAGGDLVAVGSSWMQNAEYAPELKQLARDNDLTLSVLMHDMTPVLYPHWYAAGYSVPWEQNCAGIIARADRLFVYSESTRKDVTEFAVAHDIVPPAIEKIRLADQLGTLETRATPEGQQARHVFRKVPFVLSVGGIHLRKNYALLYDVWLILRDQMGDACPHLVIVGGVSWNGGEMARVMRSDPKVSNYIHILENIDDSSLGWLYDHAIATAYPSLYEGWGLPVGESLAHGKICLSSNASSMKEIAPELTDLIDPFDRARWAAMIRHYATSASARSQREQAIRKDFVVTTWHETARQIVDALGREIHERATKPYSLGDVAVVTRNGDGEYYLASGWYQREVWGCWAKKLVPTLEIKLVHQPSEDLILSVLAKVLKPATAARRYDVRVNGTVVATWHFPPSAPVGDASQVSLLNRALIPAHIVAAAPTLLIELVGDRLCSVREVTPGSADTRTMGIGLSAFMIEARSRASDAATLLSTRGEVRAALSAGPNVNLPARLTESAHRPSLMPDMWVRDFTPFCRVGTVQPSIGVAAADGSLGLAIGLARVSYDRGARLRLILDASSAGDGGMTIGIFANEQWLTTVDLRDHQPTLVEIDLPLALLSLSDPLTLSMLASGAQRSDAPAFVLNAMQLSQDMALPSERRVVLRPGQAILPGSLKGRHTPPAHMLDGGWYETEQRSVWSLGGTGRIRFSVAPGKRDGLALVLDLSRILSGRDDDMVAVIAADGTETTLAFAKGSQAVARRLIVPLAIMADGAAEVDLRLVPNNPFWPSRADSAADPRRLGVQLLSMTLYEFPASDGTVPLVPAKAPGNGLLLVQGWHQPETDGCWAAQDPALLAFHTPEGADVPVLRGQLRPDIFRTEASVTFSVSVDDGADEPILLTVEEGLSFHLPLPAAAAPGMHSVRLSGVEPVSPARSGYGADTRPLAIRLSSIAFGPIAEPEPQDSAAPAEEAGAERAPEDDADMADASADVVPEEEAGAEDVIAEDVGAEPVAEEDVIAEDAGAEPVAEGDVIAEDAGAEPVAEEDAIADDAGMEEAGASPAPGEAIAVAERAESRDGVGATN